MGNVAYLYDDYIKDLDASSIALTSEDTNYPTENSQTEQVADCTRTVAKVAVKYQITLAVAKPLQAFAILNHNLTGGTYDLNSYTNADFTTGQVQIEANKAIRALDTFHHEIPAPIAALYWEWDFTNATSADTYFEFGRFMAYDNFTTIAVRPREEHGRGYGFRNIINETPYGVRWVHKMADGRERFMLTWPTKEDDNIPGELRTLFDDIDGDASPFVYIPDISLTPCYCVYSTQPELTWTELQHSSTQIRCQDISIELIEAIRGQV